jgi:hypothetical protein
MKSIIDRLFSTTAAGFYMILFAVAIGAATFIENDFGTSAAQKVIFQARWFELLLCPVWPFYPGQYFQVQDDPAEEMGDAHVPRLYPRHPAGCWSDTRYFSYEGTMHIREDSTSNELVIVRYTHIV